MAHVLLIDDDRELTEANKIALEVGGHRVSAAYTGQDAWNLLEKESPDIVVLDVMMEEFTSGFEVAHDMEIKYPHIPIIILTSVHEHMSKGWQYSEEKDRNWLPVRTFLEKPVLPSRLCEVVEGTLLEAKRA